MGKFVRPWFHLITQTTTDTITYIAKFQHLILTNKSMLGNLFPNQTALEFDKTLQVKLRNVPILMPESNPITQAEAAICGALEECVECNRKMFTPQGSNILMSESLNVSEMKDPTPNTGDKERNEDNRKV